MPTAQETIDKVRGRLLSGISEQRNKLASNYVKGSGTLTLQFPITAISAGTRLSVGQTVFHVYAVNPSAGTATVGAGEDGSPDVDHPAGSVVRVNPRFPDWRIFQEINNDLADLAGRGLFQMKAYEFVYTAEVDAFDIPVDDLLEPYAVRYQVPGSRKVWPYLNRPLWRLERNANTGDFPSGQALRFMVHLHPGYKVQLLYKAPFTPLQSVSDDLADSGLPKTALDLPELGAWLALAYPRELKRAMGESQPNPRRQEEIPPGSVVNSTRGVLSQRESRIAAELALLHQQYPTRSM